MSLWTLMGPYGSLCVLIDSDGPYGSSKVLMRPDGSLLVFMGLYASLWVLVGPCKSL